MFSFILTLKRELTIAYRQRIEYLNPLFFFLLVIILFPLAITSDPKQLSLIGPGVIWIALLFANLLSIENLFGTDFDDGTLDLVALNSNSFTLFILAKLFIHWITTAIPLMCVSLVLGKIFFLNLQTLKTMLLTLLLGSPILTFLCAMGAALTLGLRDRGLILILLIVPLYIPVLIFGAGAANAAQEQLPVASQLYFLAALLALVLTLVPIAIAAALKISLEL